MEESIEFPVFSTWEEIIDFYRKFLSGEIEDCPTHSGPLEEESEVIKQQLLNINKLKVLTVDSQPGLSELHQQHEIFWRGKFRDATNVEFRQRAALACFMHKPLLDKLRKAFVKKDYILLSRKVRLNRQEHDSKSAIPITISSFTYHGKERVEVQSRQCLDEIATDDMDFILNETPEDLSKVILKDLYQVNLVDPVWGRPTQLFDDLLEALQ